VHDFRHFKGTVLSSEMDLAEIKFIDKSSLKREAQIFSEKSVSPPSCESPFKIQRHLVQRLEIRILIPNSAHSSVSDLLLGS
jgi:hypothetical protein